MKGFTAYFFLLVVITWWLGMELSAAAPAASSPHSRPNFVLIVAEDMGPELGCYGDGNAVTPQIDRLAREGVRFTQAFTHSPVCAPSRSGLITGMYPTTFGTHHMRSRLLARPPQMFTTMLRKAGYTVVWPGKTDFNFDVPPNAFDSTDGWLHQLPRQPFLAYINLGDSHESKIRAPKEEFDKLTARLKPSERHDPARMRVPPYYPDAPEVRRDLANYYDLVTAVDYHVGDVLVALEHGGASANTIVLFLGDHGKGLPRAKRWIYDSGIRVPLIIRWPERIKPGSVRDDLVSFVDIAPTLLSLAGVTVPAHMQGQAFLGEQVSAREYIFAARDRMGPAEDRIRCARTERYKYIRNFHPELPHSQRIDYLELMPTMQSWRRLQAQGKLLGPPTIFLAATKPREELYDLELDPHEINNLADSPKHDAILRQLRSALDQWMSETRDMGAIPEEELIRRGLVADVLSTYRNQAK